VSHIGQVEHKQNEKVQIREEFEKLFETNRVRVGSRALFERKRRSDEHTNEKVSMFY
jgi:hypothetical protein